MPYEPPNELLGWYAERLKCAASELPSIKEQATRLVRERVALLVGSLCGSSPGGGEAAIDPYLARAWQCIDHHARKFLESEPLPFDQIVDRLETGRLAYGQVGVNILAEVTLAQGLELAEPRAAERFDADYLPAVRKAAYKVGGQRAVDAVDNFSAELVLPRNQRPPRISTFLGRTPLTTWLRTVVVNFWLTQTRRDRYERPAEVPEVVHRESPDHAVDGRPCRDLLEPVFRQAVRSIDAEDRLLLKLLLLDGVPQKDVARGMQLNSGTITRRRQKAAEQVLLDVRAQVAQSGQAASTQRCLELALTGDLPELRSGLAEVLAMAVGETGQGDLREGEAP